MVSAMRLARFKKEVSQMHLWAKTGIPQWRISLIERGLMPTEDEAERIAKALGEMRETIFPVVGQPRERELR